NLKLSTELLIAKYYRERADDQDTIDNPETVAKLHIRGFFKAKENLVIEVVMASDIEEEGVCGPDTHVQLYLVPRPWFPEQNSQATKVEKASNNMVFNEQFEFDVTELDEEKKSGHILFTVKQRRNVFTGDVVMGEAVLPIEDLLNVREHSTSPSIVLHITRPK
ncbi:unnamed protein product, partial [Meganyctiphanes norvegica]